jgi:Fe2+ transport system protein FeoA
MSDLKTLALEKELQLSKLKKPAKCQIIGFIGEHLMIERLKEMGLHKGLQIEFIGRSPLWGPFLYRFGNTILALRPREAACIQIQL